MTQKSEGGNLFHWPRKKPLIVLVSTLAAVALCVWIGTRPERQEIVGHVDPASGYRWRFTLSSLWQGEYRPLNMLDAETGRQIGLD